MLDAPQKRFKGVGWYKPMQKWRARIDIERKTTTLGYFDDEVEAAERWDEAKMATGEFMKLNFPNAPAAVTARANAVAAGGTSVINLKGAYYERGWYSNIRIPGTSEVRYLGRFSTQQEAHSAHVIAHSYLHKKEQTTEVFCEQFSLLKEEILQVVQHKRKHNTVCSLKHVLLLLYYV
jgi:hypothetical protein